MEKLKTVFHEVDLCVVGGGFGGMLTAISAARLVLGRSVTSAAGIQCRSSLCSVKSERIFSVSEPFPLKKMAARGFFSVFFIKILLILASFDLKFRRSCYRIYGQ